MTGPVTEAMVKRYLDGQTDERSIAWSTYVGARLTGKARRYSGDYERRGTHYLNYLAVNYRVHRVSSVHGAVAWRWTEEGS